MTRRPLRRRRRLALSRDRLRRIGVIDIGSNSVRLVVFDGAARSPAFFFNEKVLCGLGRGLSETGRLDPEGAVRAKAAIARFVALSENMHVSALTAVATAAVRDAADGPDFVADVGRMSGLKIVVASGTDEATLAAQGVLLGWPRANGFVCDIGGSSMEMARLEDGRITGAATSGLGPLRLTDLGKSARASVIEQDVKALRKALPGKVRRLFLVGGSWRALARVDMERRSYPLKVLHEYGSLPEDVRATARWLAGQTSEALRGNVPVSSARLELLPLAAAVLIEVLDRFGPEKISVSSYGLREGLLYGHMPAAVRKQDPLLEAARHMEQASARFPGFGATLFSWLTPALGGRFEGRERLLLAACTMHDISWRAHPDYRSEVCFETATRSNLGGLTHPERVFLGLALSYRYKSSGARMKWAGLLDLLTEEERQNAEILGRAMRLGAMIGGGSKDILGATALQVAGTALRLTAAPEAELHLGEAVQKRLSALAGAMRLDADLRYFKS